MDEDKDLRDYEIGFLGRDEQSPEVVLGALKERGAEILLEGQVEKISLAYPIKKEAGAFFGYVHFRAAAGAIVVIDRTLAGSDRIVRFLIVTPPFSKPKPRWEKKPARAVSPAAGVPVAIVPRESESLPLTNEALEKKIEEILK